jgi:hypothetical protein
MDAKIARENLTISKDLDATRTTPREFGDNTDHAGEAEV